jgi:glycosyltransferase involved in cell wall biosynthesis
MKQVLHRSDISNVIITGGRETGGLQSFAVTLADGFVQLGIPAEVISPRQIYSRWRDLRDINTLKVLSTTAVYAAPFARRAICMAHGFPRADAQGWTTTLGILASFKLSGMRQKPCLVAVSYYSSVHLSATYNIRINAVIHNPLNPLFLAPAQADQDRYYLTYVGRLHPAKNIHRLLPAMQGVLEEHPELRICVVGDGVLRNSLETRFGHDPRIEFAGDLHSSAVREVLSRTKVFISGNEMEPFGITYLEALSQGCSVVMPACGGGLEIAPELIGTNIQLMPLCFDSEGIKKAISRALNFCGASVSLGRYEAKNVASNYLNIAAALS